MCSRSANSVRPPAMAMSCRTVVGPVSTYAPGRVISPVMKALRLLICLTATVTVGASMNAAAFALIRSAS